jgi:HSP20 family protein
MRWQKDPFSQFEQLQEKMERMWQRLSGDIQNPPRYCPSTLEPPIDVYDTESNVVVVVEIAGISGSAVEVEVEDKRLTVRGQRPNRNTHPGRHCFQMEICYGSFERTVMLPSPVNLEELQTTYNDGFLEITLPKVETRQRQPVRITVAGTGP